MNYLEKLTIRGGKILLFIFLALINEEVWGGTYTYTFDTKEWSTQQTQTLNGVDWTLDGVGGGYLGAGTRGLQLGSANNPYSLINISSNTIKREITSVTVETSGAASINATLEVKVGDVSFQLEDGSVVQTLTDVSTAYTFSGSSSGLIELIWKNSSAKALYIKSITVVYAGEQIEVSPVVFSSADGDRFYTSLTVTASCMTNDAKIYYTISTTGIPEDPTETSDEFPVGGVTINQTTTIKAKAFVDGIGSEVVSATYTKIEESLAKTLRALIFEYEGTYHAAINTISSNALSAKVANCVNGKVVYSTPEDGMGWYVDETKLTIKSVDGNYVAYTGSSTNLKFQTSSYAWSYDDSNGCWYANGSTRTLLYGSEKDYIKAFAISNLGTFGYSGKMQILPFTDGYVRTVTGASSSAPRFGTICLPCAVKADDFSGAEFYSVLGKVMDGETVTAVALSEPVTELEAGIPYIFSATSEKVLAAYTGDAVTTAGNANGLVGSLNEQIDVPVGKYIVSGNKIQICGEGCYISPNRAYVDFDGMTEYIPVAGVNVRLISFDDAAAVDEVKACTTTYVDVYTSSGVCVRHKVLANDALTGLSKGVYIVGGKKTIVE